MKFDADRLYNLLPALYRLRDDALKGGEDDIAPLKALMEVLSKEIVNLEENLDQLYDDLFIETCSEWVVPYIGDLIGSRELARIPDPKYTRRAEVANTISYRRRKGTISIIEQLAEDVTNWDANVNEYFQLLCTTQYLNHLRLHNVSVPDLRNWEQLEFANTPFDSMPKTVDVRNISSGRGKYNIPNIGIFLWRIKAYPLKNSIAHNSSGLKYTFDPCGIDIPLFKKKDDEKSITTMAQPNNVASPIRRRLMRKYIDHYYGEDNKDDGDKIKVSIGTTLIRESDICIGNLEQWNSGSIQPSVDKVVIDPELGRIMFGTDFTAALAADKVIVNYHYGFSADMGGGEYEREHSFEMVSNKITVSKENIPSSASHFKTIQAALDQLKSTNKNGVVEILDNMIYEEDLSIHPNSGITFEIRAKDGHRPVIKLTNKMEIKGGPLSRIFLNGILIHGGKLEIPASSQAEELGLKHSTIIPKPDDHRILVKSKSIELEVSHSIIAGIESSENTKIHISNSIVDVKDQSKKAITGISSGNAGVLKIVNSTVMGEVHVKSISLAENVIFNSKVNSIRTQDGCVRFSYVPLESITPRKYSCHPIDESKAISIKPTYTSLDYGNPGYCQLDEHCVEEITSGASDESEMGVFHDLYQPQRISNLRTRLDEYLRFGMEAGIFYGS